MTRLMLHTPAVGFAFICLGCTPMNTSDGDPVDNTNDNTPIGSENTNAALSPLDELVGSYHLNDTNDASNLLIRSDGTFTYDSYACAATSQTSGQVAISGVFMSLVSNAAGASLAFPCELTVGSGPPVICNTTGVLINRTADGLTTIVNTIPLAWSPGRVCPRCTSNGADSIGTDPCDCTASEVEGVPLCP